MLKRLQSFEGSSMLKKASLNLLIKMTTAEELDGLIDEFKRFDKDGSGMLD